MTPTRTLRRFIQMLGAVSLLSAWAVPAAASKEYPDALRGATGAPCPPPCTICHLTNNGGSGTALKPFAESMIDLGGLQGEDESLVAPAVKALKGSDDDGGGVSVAVDSDEDGVGDIAELASGRDPNVAGGGELCGPTYGCGARIEPDGRIDGFAFGAALGVVALLVAQGRRRRSVALTRL